MNEAKTEILIVGAGLGVGGALAALRMGRKVILIEETDWIGGQLTSQAVPPNQHWLIESMGMDRPAGFHDSVGVGYYRIDLHPSTGNRPYVDITSWPFQIPLGSLIPARMRNLLPANKNIGSTHITNGCDRLHPVEWNIGEAAGALAAWYIDKDVSLSGARNDQQSLEDFQSALTKDLGFELEWPKIYIQG